MAESEAGGWGAGWGHIVSTLNNNNNKKFGVYSSVTHGELALVGKEKHNSGFSPLS